MSEYLSWSETAWATQEERLAVETKGAKLVIGAKSATWRRIEYYSTPAAVSVLVQNGHNISRGDGCGLLAGWEDREYADAGAEIAAEASAIFQCDIIATSGAANSGGNWNDEGQSNVDQCPTAKNP